MGREAEKCDPHCPQTHFILFKVALLRNDKEMGKILGFFHAGQMVSI